MDDLATPTSPRWGGMTKLIVALTGIAIVGALIIRFHTLIVPLLMAFILAYLFHPLAMFLHQRTPLSWRGAVNVIYLIFLAIVLTLLIWGGVGLVQQAQSLIVAIQNSLWALPTFLESLGGQVYRLGPWEVDLSALNWSDLSRELIRLAQPLLGRAGNLIGTLASGAASTLGWLAFIYVVSYFLLLESGGLQIPVFSLDLPGYREDFRCLGEELRRIWNAFLRGQMLLFVLTVIVYTVLLSLLGVRYTFWLALLAGLATFVPYVGPAVAWSTLGLVALFQPFHPWGASPLFHASLVVLAAILVDQVFNSMITPRIMAQALRVHPAAVLVAAVLAARLLGVVGLLLAAPLLSSLKLVGTYILRKMLDQNPWPIQKEAAPAAPSLGGRFYRWWKKRLRLWSSSLRRRSRQANANEKGDAPATGNE